MKRLSRGSILLLVLVFGGVFFTTLAGISGYVIIQNRVQDLRRAEMTAFSLAEAGLEYYRWFLAHFPEDATNGTGQPGPYEITYADPEGGDAGTYTLAIESVSSCGEITAIDVSSTGAPASDPSVRKTLTARYARPSVAQFSVVMNSNVWFGSTEVLYGPVHANGGIHMDGTANAPVTSSVSTWRCDGTYGCSGTKPGVWGSGPNSYLWSWPTPQMDFAGISADFSSLKERAQTSGLYFERVSSGTSGAGAAKGYHLLFNGDGTVTVRQVLSVNTTLKSVPFTTPNGSAVNDYSRIVTETAGTTYAVPSECSLIFVEDNVWVEGVIDIKVTVVNAVLEPIGVYPNAIIPNNITYAAYDGSAGLTLVASHHVLLGPNAPVDLILNGIFVAQSGGFGANKYACPTGYADKNSITLLGTVVTSLRPITYWITSCPSGYPISYWSFDRQLSTAPPVFTPITSPEYEFIDWREEE